MFDQVFWITLVIIYTLWELMWIAFLLGVGLAILAMSLAPLWRRLHAPSRRQRAEALKILQDELWAVGYIPSTHRARQKAGEPYLDRQGKLHW